MRALVNLVHVAGVKKMNLNKNGSSMLNHQADNKAVA